MLSENQPMWSPVDAGATMGQQGPERRHRPRRRASPGRANHLEQEVAAFTAPFAITCGIYGWMVHTRFFDAEPEASSAFEEMKDAH